MLSRVNSCRYSSNDAACGTRCGGYVVASPEAMNDAEIIHSSGNSVSAAPTIERGMQEDRAAVPSGVGQAFQPVL